MEDQIKITNKLMQRLGFHFTWGVIQCLALIVIIGSLLDLFLVPVDDCDANRFDRCGLKVVTDAKTGKQYLLSPDGGIIEQGKP